VLERVLGFGKQTRLVEELRGLQVRKATAQLVVRLLGDRLQEHPRHVFADDRGRLEKMLLGRRQPVDAGGEDGLHGRGHLDAGHRF